MARGYVGRCRTAATGGAYEVGRSVSTRCIWLHGYAPRLFRRPRPSVREWGALLCLGFFGAARRVVSGLMIYIEFTSRRAQPGIRENDRGTLSPEPFESQLARFHRAVLAGQSGWESSWSEDQMIFSMGRTWRLGPEPEYLTVWHSPAAGLKRIDDWDEVFRSGKADEIDKPFRELARIDRAGCYDALLDPKHQRNGIYYAEFFEPVGSHDAIRDLYTGRAAAHANLTLALCAVRIGKLAPDPGGLAVWTLPSYGALAAIARDLDETNGPVRLATAGVYNDIGREIL
jgi:hypothetical protein